MHCHLVGRGLRAVANSSVVVAPCGPVLRPVLACSSRAPPPAEGLCSVSGASPSLAHGSHSWGQRHGPSCPQQVRATGSSPLHVAASSCLETQRIAASAVTATPAPPRLRVAVDVDEVLGRFVYALNKFCESQYQMQHTVSDYWIYEFAKIWKVDQERSNHIVHEFFKSSHFKDGIPVIPGAFDTLQRLGEVCDLVVVTSRQHVIQDQTLDWLDNHYPGIFQEVYFGNHWSLEGVSRKKSEICKAVGASVLIDDNPGYAQECAAAGVHVLLYDWDQSYPWSKLQPEQHHPLIEVVTSWPEVERTLQRLAPMLQEKAQEQQQHDTGRHA